MSMIPKHFGLKTREESYMFKELEKVRQETKRDFLRFKHKLACRQVLDEGSDYCPHASDLVCPREKRQVLFTVPLGLTGSPRAEGPKTFAATRLQEALQGAAHPPATMGRTPSFCPREFYLRSSAFLRHRPQKKPPAISSQAGTSRPLVLKPPSTSTSLVKRRERPGPGSPRPAATGAVSGSSDAREVSRLVALRTRAVPRSIQEVIASLQSEAQLASDQTIRELKESILGENYDIRMKVGESEESNASCG
ncbi:uncharacterized protein LOC104868112 [Fukomys damarensis]|uniref:uncharacterized protein LOC104868112 n=1 Tax=Fukomys damarensis TaxID=885580 RepID=UPI00053FE1C0|nr:uncharacterized protein LOC104868112 [Fukomys damarensis]